MKNGGFTKDLPLESPCLLEKSQVSYEKWRFKNENLGFYQEKMEIQATRS
jgi:hypothetical protein